MLIFVWIYLFVCMYVCPHVCTYACLYLDLICLCFFIYFVCIYVCMYICMYVCIHACIHIYAYLLVILSSYVYIYKKYNIIWLSIHVCLFVRMCVSYSTVLTFNCYTKCVSIPDKIHDRTLDYRTVSWAWMPPHVLT